jgi:CelD/BcsL family acetyltransferase involved in cellulose biosynthesis
MFFDVSLPLNFIKVKIRASKYIANSMSDYNEGLYPEATHVLLMSQKLIL